MDVSPSAKTAAIIILAVPVTEASSSNILAPFKESLEITEYVLLFELYSSFAPSFSRLIKWVSNLLLPILSPPGLGIEADPNLERRGPTSIIEPLSDLASSKKSPLLRYLRLMSFALKQNLPLSSCSILTPRFLRIYISLFTSIMSGMLEIVTSLSDNKVAQIT